MQMIEIASCGVAALVGGAMLCPVCDGIPSTAAPAGAAVSAAPAAATAPAAVVMDTARVKLAVTGMTCGGCAMTARLALQRAEGVYRAAVSYDSASAVVWYEPAKTVPERIIATLRKMTGYEARVVEETAEPEESP